MVLVMTTLAPRFMECLKCCACGDSITSDRYTHVSTLDPLDALQECLMSVGAARVISGSTRDEHITVETTLQVLPDTATIEERLRPFAQSDELRAMAMWYSMQEDCLGHQGRTTSITGMHLAQAVNGVVSIGDTVVGTVVGAVMDIVDDLTD